MSFLYFIFAFLFQISFLSLNAMDTKNTLAAGRSEISGEWNVEEVQREQKTYRRLLFLSCAGITQSEVEVFGRWRLMEKT